MKALLTERKTACMYAKKLSGQGSCFLGFLKKRHVTIHCCVMQCGFLEPSAQMHFSSSSSLKDEALKSDNEKHFPPHLPDASVSAMEMT